MIPDRAGNPDFDFAGELFAGVVTRHDEEIAFALEAGEFERVGNVHRAVNIAFEMTVVTKDGKSYDIDGVTQRIEVVGSEEEGYRMSLFQP